MYPRFVPACAPALPTSYNSGKTCTRVLYPRTTLFPTPMPNARHKPVTNGSPGLHLGSAVAARLPVEAPAAGGRQGEQPDWPQTAPAARPLPSAASLAWVLLVQQGTCSRVYPRFVRACSPSLGTFHNTGYTCTRVLYPRTPVFPHTADDAQTTHCKQTQIDYVLLSSRVLSVLAMISVIGSPQPHSPHGCSPSRHRCFIRQSGHTSSQNGRAPALLFP